MLELDRIDTSEGMMLMKPKYYICNYYYFLKLSFRFQLKTFDGSDDLMPKAMSFNVIAIALNKGKDYGIQWLYMRKRVKNVFLGEINF